MSRCDSCGAQIAWAITDKGRRMPLDPPGTHPEPNVAVWRTPIGGLLRAGDPPAEVEVTMTTAHFATCPNAAGHRRRKR